SQNFVGVRVKVTTRQAKPGQTRRAANFERSLCPGPSPVLSPTFLPDGISSMARSCRYFYEHDPFCSWRTLLRFARCCLFLCQEALPVRGGTQTERRRRQNCATASHRRKFVHACFVDTPYVAGSWLYLRAKRGLAFVCAG